jgi:DNA mismatch endonuclease Vsr
MTILRKSEPLTRPSSPYQEQSSDQYIRGSNTQPELLVRRFLHAQGFRYRLHVKDLPGKPDIVLPKYKTVIFVNGCFWHGHKGCRYFVLVDK